MTTAQIETAPLFTFDEFVEMNGSYFRKPDQRDYAIALDFAAKLIALHDSTDEPTTGNTLHIIGWSDVDQQERIHANGLLEIESDNSYRGCTQPMAPHVGQYNNEPYLSTSGGYWFTPKRELMVRKAEKAPRWFWTWGADGVGASKGIYFQIPVPVWEYKDKTLY